MTKRSYGQYCAVARGLDVLADRWLLLIVRDLLLGPKRYNDLLAGLPGIGTNMLAMRLREMVEAGLIERVQLPVGAGSQMYRLTESGRDLESVIVAVGRWGARLLGVPRDTDFLLPRAYFVAMREIFRSDLAAGVSETYEFRVGDLVFEVSVGGGRCTTREGAASAPDVVAEMEVATLHGLLFDGLAPATALRDGRIIVRGNISCLERFVALFAFRHTTPAALSSPPFDAPSTPGGHDQAPP
jgi:DNA-binding HxlR family transcriptional regulator